MFAEWPFEIVCCGNCQSGIIDLLCVDAVDDMVEIVDWKTDALSEVHIQQTLERHREQLWRYANAMNVLGKKISKFGIFFSCFGNFFPIELDQ
jgi:hypothetical protein